MVEILRGAILGQIAAIEFDLVLVAITRLFLPLDEAVAFKAVFGIVYGSDGRAETLLKPAK